MRSLKARGFVRILNPPPGLSEEVSTSDGEKIVIIFHCYSQTVIKTVC